MVEAGLPGPRRAAAHHDRETDRALRAAGPASKRLTQVPGSPLGCCPFAAVRCRPHGSQAGCGRDEAAVAEAGPGVLQRDALQASVSSGIRTRDRSVMSRLLYPAEPWKVAVIVGVEPTPS